MSIDTSSTNGIRPGTGDRSWRLAVDWNPRAAREITSHVDPSAAVLRELLRAREPVILRGFAKQFRCTKTWTLPVLACRVGPREVPLVRVHEGMLGYGRDRGMDYVRGRFDELCRELDAGGAPDRFLNLDAAEHLPEIASDLELPWPARVAAWKSSKITIAGVGNTTPIHRELPDNLYTVIHGEKELVLFPPSDTLNVYGFNVFSGAPHISSVDPRHRDVRRHPRIARCTPFHGRVGAGDTLLIPRLWWHAVATPVPTIAYGVWWADGWFSLLPRAAELYKKVGRIRT